MKRSKLALLLLALVGLLAFAGEKKPAAADKPSANTAPQFTTDNQLIRPENYREWVYVSSGLGMSYSGEADDASMGPMFDNVWVHPDAYRQFMATGLGPTRPSSCWKCGIPRARHPSIRTAAFRRSSSPWKHR